MRIRHPRSMQSEKSLDSSIMVDSQNSQSTRIPNVSGSGNSLSTSVTETTSQTRRVSPQLSKAEGHVSPGPIHNDHAEDANTTYLKPDFYDPLVLTKSDPVCPSPLAMLAKTCQNIGQMMEASVHPNHSTQSATSLRLVTSSVSATTTTSTSTIGNTLPTAVTVSASNPVSGPTQRLSPIGQGTKNVKQPKGSSPSAENKTPVNAKRPNNNTTNSMSRFKWMRPEPNGPAIDSHRAETVSSSTPHSDYSPTNGTDGINSRPKFPTTIPSPHSLSAYPLNGGSPGSSVFRDMIPGTSGSQQPTSNALAQLARLSSSLSLPDPPRSVNGVVDGLSKDRLNWNDPLRIQTGTKRIRRNSGTGPKGFSLLSSNGPISGTKRAVRDSYLHSNSSAEGSLNGLNNQNKMNTSNPTSHNTSVRQSPQLDQASSPNDPQAATNPWFALSEFLHQMMEQKNEQSNRAAAAQDTFSYNLARSFLDFFYSRMMMLTNGSAATSAPDCAPIPPFKDTVPNLFTSYPTKDNAYTGHCSTLNRTSVPSMPQVPPSSFTESMPSGYQSAAMERCFFCGQSCTSQAEWCLHMYTHFSQLEKKDGPTNTHQPHPSLVPSQQQNHPLPTPHDSVDTSQDCNPSKFTSPPFPFCFPPSITTSNSSSSSSSFSSPVNPSDSTSPSKSNNSDYMYMINSYLAAWMDKYKDMNGTKPTPVYPLPSFTDPTMNPFLPYMNPAIPECSSNRPDFPPSKFTDPSMYMYWMYLYAAYCGGNMNSRSGYPTQPPQQPSPTLMPPCPPSNTMGWPHSLMSAFGIAGPGLGVFPKV